MMQIYLKIKDNHLFSKRRINVGPCILDAHSHLLLIIRQCQEKPVIDNEIFCKLNSKETPMATKNVQSHGSISTIQITWQEIEWSKGTQLLDKAFKIICCTCANDECWWVQPKVQTRHFSIMKLLSHHLQHRSSRWHQPLYQIMISR
jgi:DNA-directed RNA polymerase subunit M/transcription elongation factor TFIIS